METNEHPYKSEKLTLLLVLLEENTPRPITELGLLMSEIDAVLRQVYLEVHQNLRPLDSTEAFIYYQWFLDQFQHLKYPDYLDLCNHWCNHRSHKSRAKRIYIRRKSFGVDGVSIDDLLKPTEKKSEAWNILLKTQQQMLYFTKAISELQVHLWEQVLEIYYGSQSTTSPNLFSCSGMENKQEITGDSQK